MNNKTIGKSETGSGVGLLIFISWLIYAVSYLGKVNYSANIAQIVDAYGISKTEAGMAPSFLFFSYGAGQVVNGLLCKKYNIRWMIFAGLFTSAVVNFAVALSLTPEHFWIVKWLWMINGIALSILWPTVIRLLSETLPHSALGKSSLVMGTTVATGTLVIYCLSAIFALFNSFKLAFFVAAIVQSVVSVLWAILYKRAVKSAKKEFSQEAKAQAQEDDGQNASSDKAEKKILMVTIGILCIYAIIVNLTKDGLTTWVPSILGETFGLSSSLSILLTLMLTFVAMFGNVGAWKMHKRIPDYVTHCFIVFSILCAFIAAIIASMSSNMIIFTLAGLIGVTFLTSSLNSLITSLFPVCMRGKVNSGMFAGVLNGFCYLGSTISSYGLGYVADNFGGWTSVFWLLIGLCVFASLLWCVYRYIKYKIS